MILKKQLKTFILIHDRLKDKKITLNQEDIVVAMGIIKNPISLKKIMLIKIFNRTEIKEI